jgi:tetratricopeptide (TPR) repeat protein
VRRDAERTLDMADPIDELVQRWKQNPSAGATIALCEALRGSARGALVVQVGELATQRHSSDVSVMLAVARMYLHSNKLGEAQSTLVTAGKLAPREGAVYRWLGETLLRRGDAERAEKVLERAIQLGAKDAEARLWLERARVFRPMQQKAGTRAVAAEVAHVAQAQSGLPPARAPMDSFTDTTTVVRDMPPGRDEATGAPRNGALALSESGESASLEQTALRPQAPQLPKVVVPDDEAENLDTTVFEQPKKPSSRPPPPVYPKDTDTAPAFTPLTPPPPLEASGVDVEISVQAPPPRAPAPMPSDPPAAKRALQKPAPPAPALDRTVGDHTVGDFGNAFAPPPARPAPPPAPKPAPETGGAAVPHPRDVLDALQLAGVFEPEAGGSRSPLQWDRAEKQPKRWRSPVVVGVLTVLLVGGGIGGYRAVKLRREKQHVEAEAILGQVETDLREGRHTAFADDEKKMYRVFTDLDSRSPRASLDWLKERCLVAWLKASPDVSFEDGIVRAIQVGMKEDDIIFARVASSLFQNDVGTALGVLAQWDGPAGRDPWYELMAGATLERAGDSRARERYAAAVELEKKEYQDDLFVAKLMLTRSEAIDGDLLKAIDMAKVLRTEHPERAETAALVALGWARDPGRSDTPPPEAEVAAQQAGELPSTLAFVPDAVKALRAIDKKDWDEAKAAIGRALGASDTPGIATWIGMIALATGDEQLSRKAALRAIGYSAVYEPARLLAARVALLGDRLDEALKATEGITPAAPDVAVVRAAVAYERLDLGGMSDALGALSQESLGLPMMASIRTGTDVLMGRALPPPAKIIAFADDDAPWSDLVAMDAALDEGELATADKIAASWQGSDAQPLRALRLARLARYERRLDDADRLSQAALQGTVTPRAVIERAFVLVARNAPADATSLLGRYPSVLGPLSSWLSAYIAASSGKVDDARGRTATLDVQPASAPLLARVAVAASLGAMKDKKRGADYLAPLVVAAPNPDVVAAALALGFKQVDHANGKPPTFEPPP